jgi:Phage P22-like portal protein
MARKTKATRMAETHALALRRFDDAYQTNRDDRELARISRRFVNIRGAHWDWDARGQFKNRPKMEIDHISGAVQKVKNEYRKNTIAATFLPSDGTEAEALADACTSRYRADTQDARGKQARKQAFDDAVEGGIAGLRLRAEYEKGEHQRICLEPISDAEATLYFDPNAKMQDKSDAAYAFQIVPWTRAAFVDTYGEEGASWPEGMVNRPVFQWFGISPDLVYVAEYFVKEERTDTWQVFENEITGETEEYLEEDVDDETEDRLTATGFVEIEPRKEDVDQVVKYILNGAKVLEDRQVIPGPNIPLIPQYGVRTVIDHVERFHGKVAPAIDSQVVYDVQVSKVFENAAASSIEKPIFSPEQIGPYGDMWQNDNVDNNAFMFIKSLTDANGNPMPAGPLGYTKSPDVPPAVAALITLTRQDISDQMGNPENGEMMQPDTSGIALDLVQGRIDMGSYGFMDNAADTERRVAEIWLGMAKEIYTEKGRKLRTLSEDGKRGSVEIGRKILDKKTGQLMSEIDFSRVDMDVDVSVGPTSASRRAAVVRTLVALKGATSDPEMAMMMDHMALMNLEGEGLQDLRDYSRKRMVALGVIKPTKEEEEELAASQEPQPPDPQALLAQALTMESEAKAMKAKADAILAAARTEETQAKTAETLAGIPLAQQKQALETARAIADDMKPQEPMNAGPV